MARFDTERLLTDIATFLQANLTAKLSEIDTEKGDGITLATVNSNAYFQQFLDDATANYDPFIVYGVTEFPEVNGIGPVTAVKHLIHVVIVKQDNGSDRNMIKRLWRYQRALKELFEYNWATAGIGKSVKFKVSNLAPTSLELLNRSFPDRAVGVSLEATIA